MKIHLKIISKIKALYWLAINIGLIKTIIILTEIIFKIHKEHLVSFNFNGKNVYFYIESKRTDLALLTEIFCFKCYEIKKKIDPKLIIDAGSNKGAATIYFSIIYPQAKIDCFEPNEDILPILRKNLKLNKINSRIFPYAVSDKEKIVYFEKGENHQYSKLSIKKTNYKVNAITLNRLYKNKKIGILKLDVEGEEEKIIASLKKLNIKTIIGEIHYDRVNFSKIQNILKRDYKLEDPYPQYKLLNFEEKYPIIVAIGRRL
jgi:FkbM family methyltransferase